MARLKGQLVRSSQPDARTALSAPPLFVWLIVAAASAVLFLISLPAFNQYNSGDKMFFDASVRRLESLPERGTVKKGLRVIALGSSLMGRAVPFDKKMEELAEGQGLAGLEFVRVSRPNADLKSFRPLLDALARSRPDLILIESDSVLYDRRDDRFFRKYADFFRAMLMESLKSKRPVLPQAEKVYLDNEFDIPVQVKNRGRALAAAVHAWKRRKMSAPEDIKFFFSEAARKGISVKLVRIQRSPEFEKLIHDDGLKTARLLKNYGLKSLNFPGEIRAEYYSDHAHLNSEGRAKFSLWLIEEFKKTAGGI